MSVQSPVQPAVQSLWSQAVAGDREAFGEYLSGCYKQALAGASRYAITAGSGIVFDSDDACQVALVYAMECFDAGAFGSMTEQDFRMWLFVQGKEKSKQLVRHSRRAMRDARKTASIGEAESTLTREQSSVEQAVELREQVSILFAEYADCEQVLRGLMDGMTATEIADSTGLTLPQVWYQIKKVRRLATAAKSL